VASVLVMVGAEFSWLSNSIVKMFDYPEKRVAITTILACCGHGFVLGCPILYIIFKSLTIGVDRTNLRHIVEKHSSLM
jgi:hypothetical protein